MSENVPVSELKKRTAEVLEKAVIDRQDVIIERYGRAYAVLLSPQRYQELVDAAEARVRERFLASQQELYDATRDIAEEEISRLVEDSVKESRRDRAG